MTAQRVSKQANLTSLEANLVQLEIDIAEQRAVVESLRDDVEEEPKKQIFFRAPSSTAHFIIEGIASDESGQEIDYDTFVLRAEELNPSYTVARNLEIGAASLLQGLEKQESSTVLKIAQLVKDIDELNDDIVEQRTENKRLTRVVDTMERTFELAASSWDKSKTASVNVASDIQIVADAVIPGRSIRLSPLFGETAALLLGALLSAANVVARAVLLQAVAPIESDGDRPPVAE
jgi:uncharacterized coiled-coil protein SlyX